MVLFSQIILFSHISLLSHIYIPFDTFTENTVHRAVRWYVYQEATDVSLFYRSLLHVSFHIPTSLLTLLQRTRCIAPWGDTCIKRQLVSVSFIGLFYTSLFTYLRHFWQIYREHGVLRSEVIRVSRGNWYQSLLYVSFTRLFSHISVSFDTFTENTVHHAVRWYVYDEAIHVSPIYRRPFDRSHLHVSFHISVSLLTHLRRTWWITPWGDTCMTRPLTWVSFIGLFYTSLFTYLRHFWQIYREHGVLRSEVIRVWWGHWLESLLYVSFTRLFPHLCVSFDTFTKNTVYYAVRWYVYDEATDLSLFYRSLMGLFYWSFIGLFYTSFFTYLRLCDSYLRRGRSTDLSLFYWSLLTCLFYWSLLTCLFHWSLLHATDLSLIYWSLLHVFFHISATLRLISATRPLAGDTCIKRPLKLVTIIGLFNTSLFAYPRLFWHIYLCAPWLDTCLKMPVYLL